jgi:hypothetical protein
MQFKEGLELYNRQLLKIILVTVTIFLPMYLFVTGWIVFFQQTMEIELINYYLLFFYILLFITILPPYIAIAKSDLEEEEITYWELWKSFLTQFGLLVMATLVLYSFAVAGVFFLYIPSFIALGFLLLFPLYINDRDKISEMIKNAWVGFKTSFLDLLLFIVLALSVNLLVWYLLSSGISYFESNLLTYTILRMIINLIVFPYFFILLTINFHPDFRKSKKWDVY